MLALTKLLMEWVCCMVVVSLQNFTESVVLFIYYFIVNCSFYLILKALVNKLSTLLCLVWVAKDVIDLETESTFYFLWWSLSPILLSHAAFEQLVNHFATQNLIPYNEQCLACSVVNADLQLHF